MQDLQQGFSPLKSTILRDQDIRIQVANIDYRYKFKEGKAFINGVEGFWSFAKERLIKYQGISKHNSSCI